MADKAPETLPPEILAPIEVPGAETAEIAKELGGVLDFLGGISEVDTEGVEPFDVVEFLGIPKPAKG